MSAKRDDLKRHLDGLAERSGAPKPNRFTPSAMSVPPIDTWPSDFPDPNYDPGDNPLDVAPRPTPRPQTCPACGVNTEVLGGGYCPRCSEIR